MSLPSQARIVVIGGGAVGCSIAYHLGKLGQKDVLVLEKSGLTHGSTWHAAGLVGQLRSKRNLTRLMQYSAQLYGKLEAETGQATEWKPVGSLRLASSEERWSELKRMATTARSFDFELHTLSPKEAHDKFPLATSDGVVGAVFVPNDGSVEPSSLTMAYAKGARSSGVRIVENVLVTGFEADGRRIKRVLTDQGAVACEIVVDRRRHLGARRGAHGGRAGAGRRGRAPVPDHREEQRHPARPADAARSRSHLLSQARARGAGDRRLGKGHAHLRRQRRAVLVRPRASAAQPGAVRAVRAARRRAPADPERARHPHGDQRADPDLARRRADHGSRAGTRQCLRRLRLHLGHRGLRRRRQGDGGMDRRGRAGPRPVGLRRAPLRQPSHERQVPRRAQRRQLLALLPDPLSDRGAGIGARRPALAALSPAQGQERRVRLALRLGAAQLVRAGRHRGDRQAVLREPAQLVRPGRRRMPRRARARRADRPELVLQVRDHRTRRLRRPAAARRQRPRQAAGRAGLHPALQRARRHRGRPHLRPARREPLLHGDRQRLRRARHGLDQEAPADRRLGQRAGADLGARHDQPRRAAVARRSSSRSPTATSATRPFPT